MRAKGILLPALLGRKAMASLLGGEQQELPAPADFHARSETRASWRRLLRG